MSGAEANPSAIMGSAADEIGRHLKADLAPEIMDALRERGYPPRAV